MGLYPHKTHLPTTVCYYGALLAHGWEEPNRHGWVLVASTAELSCTSIQLVDETEILKKHLPNSAC